MTPAPRLRGPLHAEHAAVRRAHALRAASAAAVRVLAVLAALVVLGAVLPVAPRLAAARLALFAGGATALLALAVRAFVRDSPRFDTWLEGAESRFPGLRSWLRNALDLESRDPAGASPELSAALRAETGRRLAGVPLASLRPRLGAGNLALRAAVPVAAIALCAVFAPRATLTSWRTLWNPALAAPPVTLAVEPGSVTVSPGATLAIHARVRGTTAAPRLLGQGPQPRAVLEGDAPGERRWRFDLPPVTAPRDYAVRAANTESPSYAIRLAGEPQPVSFSIAVTPPAYARLGVQEGRSTRGDLTGLRGSRAEVEVTFDRDLVSLASVGVGGARDWQAVTPRRWRSTLPVTGAGEYELRATAASGAGRTRYRVSVTDDAPPVLLVHVPDRDVDLPEGQQVPFDLEAQDDLGLSEVRLQFRKGAGSPWQSRTLAGYAAAPREARLAAAWDAAALALLPGESATFRFEAYDDNAVSGRGRAVSPEFQLRFPSLSELYSSLEQHQESVQHELEKVADRAREAQKSLDQLQRNPPRGPQSQAPQFERSEEMRRTLERQMELSRQIDEAAQRMQQHLDDAAEREAYPRELQEKLREMTDLLKEIQSDEFKQALQRLQQALQRMDRNAMEQTLPQVRQENQQLLQNLQRSIELLKQLREEERMEALAKRAEDLARQQDELNQRHEAAAGTPAAKDPAEQRGENAARAGQQQQAAEQAKQLAQEAREASQRSEDAAAKQSLEAAAEELSEEAAPQQEQAAQQAQQGQNQRAQKSGQQASQSLQKAANQMSQSARSQAAQRQQEQLAAVRRAAQDLVSLQRAASENLSQPAAGSEQADRQTDLSQGVARVADSLATLSQETPFLSPQVSESLGRAMQGLSQSGRDLAGQNAMRGQEAGRAGAAALNEAVLALRATEQAMCNNPGQGMPGQQGQRGQRMGQMAQTQGQLNQRSQNLTRRLSQQLSMSTNDQAELKRLADDQRRLRTQLEQLQGEEARAQEKRLLGRLDQTKREMQEVEEQIRAGEVGSDLEEKQVRILSRMLDAQRSMNRRDFDPEREARRGEDVARASAPELPADLGRTADRLRSGLLKAGADRYPAQYRAFIEEYLRSLQGADR